MNKKEISEIKKLFTPAGCAITRICGCYVDSEKNKRTELKEAFLSLPEEEAFKYFTIFRGAMSGTLGKNLINMEFPLQSEAQGGTQEFLLRLRDSGLKDEALVEAFYDKVIEHYDYGENYYIILIHCAYDIPAKATDGSEMFDASDYVYEFIQCSICPVKLSKAGLCYNAVANVIENRSRDWLVEAPDLGFLFPAFNDRNTDLHSLLYYTKNGEELRGPFIDGILGCQTPMSAKSQKETFQALVEETLGEGCDFNTVKSLHESLNEMLEERAEDPEPLSLDKYQVRRLLEDHGADPERLEELETIYPKDEKSRDASFLASNVASSRTFEIKTPDVSIKVAPDKAYLVETRMIEGRCCIVIEAGEHVAVNGITVRPLPASQREGAGERPWDEDETNQPGLS